MIKFDYFNADGLVINSDKILSYEVSLKIRDAIGVDRVTLFGRYSVALKLGTLCDKQEIENGLKNILREENYLD
jgi:hypothetical protein